MIILEFRNVHDALPYAMDMMYHRGIARDSRNGGVLQYPYPVATVYSRPEERVLFHQWRDANPFFHFYESLWMLAGRNDVAPLTRYVKRMANFSDDGDRFNAAYGWRWRKVHGDQLRAIVGNLRKNNNDRRCVLQIWDCGYDMIQRPDTIMKLYDGKDAACNLTATFQINDGALDMVVFCRSNDIIWGCYGANAVHFSMLLEYMAGCIRVPVGTYTQISVNWHAYRNVFDDMRHKMKEQHSFGISPYESGIVSRYSMINTPQEVWDVDVRRFVSRDGRAPADVEFDDPFFYEVALPIVKAHDAYKDKTGHQRFTTALSILDDCRASDWKVACKEWITRRMHRWMSDSDTGPNDYKELKREQEA